MITLPILLGAIISALAALISALCCAYRAGHNKALASTLETQKQTAEKQTHIMQNMLQEETLKPRDTEQLIKILEDGKA